MKKINITLIILLSCLSIDFYAHNNEEPKTSHNFNSSSNLLVQESALYIKKNAWLIALIPVLAYYHKDITNFISHRPYISSLAFYILLHYVCDSILSYRQQKSILETINLLKKIALYLVVTHGLKNHLCHNMILIEQRFIDDQAFFSSVTTDLPYSFHEITLITLQSYCELKSSLQSLNAALPIESEEFVFLCYASSSITMQNLLYLAQNDPILYEKIYQFQKNPHIELAPFLEYLKSEITKNFIELEQFLALSHVSIVDLKDYHQTRK
ncbi:MAG: hypothetical protein Q8Q60_04970 [Candidatus Chromulinivorax sp.]|nr:hypothetical protein [Candidatus Chromulinivorax sp.]